MIVAKYNMLYMNLAQPALFCPFYVAKHPLYHHSNSTNNNPKADFRLRRLWHFSKANYCQNMPIPSKLTHFLTRKCIKQSSHTQTRTPFIKPKRTKTSYLQPHQHDLKPLTTVLEN